MLMDEQRLIVRILEGHAEDYGYFLERYGGEVFAIVSRLVPNREDAEDLTQDTFVRAYSRLDSFIGRSSFSTWVCRIAYSVAISWLRKRRIRYLSIDDLPHVSDAEVDEALDEQMLLELFYFESRPLADIAYILDVEPGTIATRLHRIRRKLYSMISRK